MGIDACGVETDPDEGSAERVGDRQAAARDAAVLLFLAAVERELFLCGAVCCGIEAPPLPGGLVQELQSRRVLGEQLAGDERPLHRPGKGSPPDDVPQPERGEKLASAYRQGRVAAQSR